MREFRARSRSTRAICFCPSSLMFLTLVWSSYSFAEKCWRANKSSRKYASKNLFCLKFKPKLPNSNWAQQFAVSIGTKYGATTVKQFVRPQETANYCETFCSPGCHRSSMSWIQAKYKVVLQMLYQCGQRNNVYLASRLQTACVTNYMYWTDQLIRHRLVIIDTEVCTVLDCCRDFRNLLTSKLNEIEEKERILFQIFLLQLTMNISW